jgi:hypothetical protein
MRHIKYKSGYKYVLSEDYRVNIDLFGIEFETDMISLSIMGNLVIRKGYAWDGPSGPAIDTKTFMRGSMVHDALYQAIREGHLTKTDRLYADQLLRKMCVEDGMSSVRAWWVYTAVRTFAARAADPESGRKIQEAP